MLDLRRRGTGDLTAEGRHQLIILRAFDLQHLQVRSIAVNFSSLSRFCEDWRLGEVREDERQGDGRLAWHLKGETATLHFDRVDAVDARIIAVDIELTLVHLQQTAFYLEVFAIFTTGGEEKSGS